MKTILILIFFMSFIFSSCISEENDGEICENGLEKCGDGKVMLCNFDSSWVVSDDCAARGATCIEDSFIHCSDATGMANDEGNDKKNDEDNGSDSLDDSSEKNDSINGSDDTGQSSDSENEDDESPDKIDNDEGTDDKIDKDGDKDDSDSSSPANPSCNDSIKNGTETDVDCGGNCAPCQTGKECSTNYDCESFICTEGVCQESSCDDGIKNGHESEIDCGGACEPCGVGQGCNNHLDCSTKSCINSVCTEPSCSDLSKNGDETGIDCGGPTCDLCRGGMHCEFGSDCESGICNQNICLEGCNVLNNGSAQGGLSGWDLFENGGDGWTVISTRCPDEREKHAFVTSHQWNRKRQTVNLSNVGYSVEQLATRPEILVGEWFVRQQYGGDFYSLSAKIVAENGTQIDSFSTGNKTVNENWIFEQHTFSSYSSAIERIIFEDGGKDSENWGGHYGAILDGAKATVLGFHCPSCSDNYKNGDETAVDCGGSCKKCGDELCTNNSECMSGICQGTKCTVPNCSDSVRNGSETDMDCGGSCVPCHRTKHCVINGDCLTGNCTDGLCI